ncbi:uncharacterized protein LOC111717969, partial [Eurytemora carolleeae]|uniref:uncharacterized protein LOC111717969 n=1 Tax=Eurytemora carolleeae TaxID=1294199 RepID=UPI000C756A37
MMEKAGTNDLVEQENRRDERKQDDESRTLDPGLIEKLKSELSVPLQKTRSKATAEDGVSKLALEQLIQAGSARVGYERSVTHSTVWTRFYKILLDEVEIPFVSCIQCGKIYTHDRSLGTSSLLRYKNEILCAWRLY